MRPFFAGTLGAAVLSSAPSNRIVTVPTLPFTPSNASLPLSSIRSINVHPTYANWVDTEGETLIPPTLYAFAQTFRSDLEETFGVSVPILNSSDTSDAILLTIDTSTGTYLDAAGRESAEGYSLNVTSGGAVISGASSLGAWWGTRSLLQLAAVSNSSLPTGHAVDTPGWATRGVMLDAGRHYYPPAFLIETCAYLSYFKQNTLHLHLSDNLVTVYTKDRAYTDSLYSSFRLDSDDPSIASLDRRTNESYTRQVFEDMQHRCAARGVTIVPEIEAPGHALVITQWKPELALSTDYTMLNISVPETIPTVQRIWAAVLPWMHSKTVSIGADEYNSSFVHEYNTYVNSMNSFLASHGKKTRIWGTFPPRGDCTDTIAQNVSVQHWEFFEDNPLTDYVHNNISVVNSDDAFYVVQKWSGSYPQKLNRTRIFHGAPDGGPYAPNIFDTANATNNPARDEPLVMGEIAAIWSDYGPNSTVHSEAYWTWRDNLPALADKQWGGSLLESEYDAVFPLFHSKIPGQNLDMTIQSKTATIVHYDFTAAGKPLADLSGNGYEASNHGCSLGPSGITFDGECYLSTPLDKKGRNYTLSLDVYPHHSVPGGRLVSNADSSLVLGNGTMTNLTMIGDGNAFSLSYTLPIDTWSTVALVASGDRTFVRVGDGKRMELTTVIGVAGNAHVWDLPMGFPAPLACIGKGFRGVMRSFRLVDGSVEERGEIAD